jgi:hypothetical protein
MSQKEDQFLPELPGRYRRSAPSTHTGRKVAA